MSIDGMFFLFSEDLHLLPKQTSQRLDQNLVFSVVGASAKQADEYLAVNHDVTLAFQPLLRVRLTAISSRTMESMSIEKQDR
jgi:hypothetical protein